MIQRKMTLKPALQIKPPEWLVCESSQKLMTLLGGFDDAPKACFVGGCVRNHLMGVPVGDFDVATVYTPDVVQEKLEAAGVKVIPTGIEHGTVTAVFDGGFVYEITTLRKDVETDGRRAVVAFSDSWVEDAERRDFTFNTLLMDGHGRVYDPVERGLEDLEAGRVIFVGDPAARIQEDHLRILRYFRFWALYGKADLDAEVLAVCEAFSDKIEGLSRERVTQEVMKIISSYRLADVLSLFKKYNVLPSVSNILISPEFIEKITKLQKLLDINQLDDCLLRLLAVDRDDYARVRSLFSVLRLSKKQEKFLVQVADVMNRKWIVSEQKLKEVAYYEGRDVSLGWLQCSYAAGGVDFDVCCNLYSVISDWQIPSFPISGRDLMAQGMAEGAALGEVLRDVEAWWVSQGFKPSRDECLTRVY